MLKEEEKKGRSVVPLNLQGAAAEGREGSMIKSKTPIRVAIFLIDLLTLVSIWVRIIWTHSKGPNKLLTTAWDTQQFF